MNTELSDVVGLLDEVKKIRVFAMTEENNEFSVYDKEEYREVVKIRLKLLAKKFSDLKGPEKSYFAELCKFYGANPDASVPLNGNELRIFDKKIENMPFANKVKTILQKNGIEYLGELVNKRDENLLLISGFGKMSLHEVKKEISYLGLSTGMELVIKYIRPEQR